MCGARGLPALMLTEQVDIGAMLARSTTAVLASMNAKSNFSDGDRAETLVSRRGRSCGIIHIGICHGDESSVSSLTYPPGGRHACLPPATDVCAHPL